MAVIDFPVDEQWKLSAAYGWKQSDTMSFSLGATLSFVGMQSWSKRRSA